MPQGRSGRVRKISPPTGIRSPDHPLRNKSLSLFDTCSCGLFFLSQWPIHSPPSILTLPPASTFHWLCDACCRTRLGERMVSMSSTLVETVSINYEDFNESFLTCGTCLCEFTPYFVLFGNGSRRKPLSRLNFSLGGLHGWATRSPAACVFEYVKHFTDYSSQRTVWLQFRLLGRKYFGHWSECFIFFFTKFNLLTPELLF